MHGGGRIDTSAAIEGVATEGNGGSITIKVGKLVYLNNSDILARAGNVGGNITIDPQFVILNNSVISAFGLQGEGNITIDTKLFVRKQQRDYSDGNHQHQHRAAGPGRQPDRPARTTHR